MQTDVEIKQALEKAIDLINDNSRNLLQKRRIFREPARLVFRIIIKINDRIYNIPISTLEIVKNHPAQLPDLIIEKLKNADLNSHGEVSKETLSLKRPSGEADNHVADASD